MTDVKYRFPIVNLDIGYVCNLCGREWNHECFCAETIKEKAPIDEDRSKPKKRHCCENDDWRCVTSLSDSSLIAIMQQECTMAYKVNFCPICGEAE